MEKPKKPDAISAAECTEQVKLMARRMALMYHHIGLVLTEQLGKERAKALLKEAIWRYGAECGETVRRKVQAMGLPLILDNYGQVPDLPRFGWDTVASDEGGVSGPRVNYCPLASVWLEKGSTELGRVY